MRLGAPFSLSTRSTFRLLGLLVALAVNAALFGTAKAQTDSETNGTSAEDGEVILGEGLSESALQGPPPTPSSYALGNDRVIVIGTAPVAGVYYAAGGAICQMINAGYSEHGIRCLVQPSSGSEENLQALAAQRIDLAIVQSDWQHYAYRGLGPFRNAGANPGLRSLFSLHRDAMVFVAGKANEIQHVVNLKGKRLNMGLANTGQRALTDLILSAGNLAASDLASALELDTRRQSVALCDGSIDAFILPASTPSYAIAEAVNACGGRVLPLDGPNVRAIVKENPYFVPYSIPKGAYRTVVEDVPTFALVATVVATEELPEDIAYQVVSSIIGNLDGFTRQHLALRRLKAEDLKSAGASAPLHDGAQRAFAEKGLQ